MKSHEIQHFFIPFLHPVLSEFSGFKLTDGTPVTFRLYVDNLGAGALDVSMAWAFCWDLGAVGEKTC